MQWAEKLLSQLNTLGAGIRNICIADTEFHGADGDVPVPVCSVFYNPISGQTIRQFYEAGGPYPSCPVDLSENTLFVAFAAQAELMTFIQLGWEMPRRILDLFVEWRHLNNEEFRPKAMKAEKGLSPFGLLGACSHYSILVQSREHKDEMRKLVLKGHPYTDEEREKILDYCQEDVMETAALAERMLPDIPSLPNIPGLKAAVYRGASARGFAWARTVGIPMDTDTLDRLDRHWPAVMAAMSGDVQREFPIFLPGSSDIAPTLWEGFLQRAGLLATWPRTKGGRGKSSAKPQPKRDDKTLCAMADRYPIFHTLRSYLKMRSCTKLGLQFPVGKDRRSRVHFWDYGTVTSRCSPSSKKFVLAGGSPAFRHLVKPQEDECLIEMDWSSQEIWIAAYLSGDKAMKRMLAQGDPYVAFGVMAKLLPADATKKAEDSPYWKTDPELAKRHAAMRNHLKAVALGVLYGKTHYTIATETGMTVEEAKNLLRLHRRLFPTFWNWIEGVVTESLATRRISSKFGWTMKLLSPREREQHLDENGRTKKVQNSLQNFPMQTHGAEMLRLALTYAADDKIPVCAPLHDAIFAAAPVEKARETVDGLLDCMRRASLGVIGAEVPVEVEITYYPDRYVSAKKPKAIEIWKAMMNALEKIEAN